MQLDVIKLSQMIDKMEEYFGSIFSTENDELEIEQALTKYVQAKKDLLLYLFDKPIQITDTKHFAEVRKRLQRLALNGDPFLPDKIEGDSKFNDTLAKFNGFLDPEFSINEVQQLASDEFYSWFSGEDYVINKIKSQLLFLQTERLPQHFKDFVTEIQDCYNFQKYIAASVLCRTVLEITIRDLFNQNKLSNTSSKYWTEIESFYEKKRVENKNFYIETFDPTLNERIIIISLVTKFSAYSNEMHEVRIMGNSIVHGNRTANRETCTELIKKTFFLIHHLYEVN
tara:strand:- start:24389 stop:25240 length:852 start_codon:yes stop_codon:yes gene_type:complete